MLVFSNIWIEFCQTWFLKILNIHFSFHRTWLLDLDFPSIQIYLNWISSDLASWLHCIFFRIDECNEFYTFQLIQTQFYVFSNNWIKFYQPWLLMFLNVRFEFHQTWLSNSINIRNYFIGSGCLFFMILKLEFHKIWLMGPPNVILN